MNAWAMGDLLMRDRWRRHVCIPNFTPRQWWECDLFMLSPANRWTEYETKLTRADFHADKTKYIRRLTGEWPNYKQEDFKKHDLLAGGDKRGPNHFYFVSPSGLLKLTDIPEWAGWIEVAKVENRYRGLAETTVKKAPLLHKGKASIKVRLQAMKCCYWRMQDLLNAASFRASPSSDRWEPSRDNWSI